MGGQSDLDIFRIHRTFNLRYIQNRVGEKIYQSYWVTGMKQCYGLGSKSKLDPYSGPL